MTTFAPRCERADSAQQPHPRPGRPHMPRSSRRRTTPSSESSSASAATLTAVILSGCASQAANTFSDARRLALRLHNDHNDELREDARLALDVAMALNEIASEAHRAAEIAAQAEMGGAAW